LRACVDACPNQAIYPADGLPAAWSDYARIDAAWYGDAVRARDAVDALRPMVPAI